VHESPFREFAGIIFNKIVRGILWLPFVDTQCGFKAFQRERCGVIFGHRRLSALDLTRAAVPGAAPWIARGGNSRALGHSPATKVSMLRDSIQMFVDVFTIRWNSLRGPLSAQSVIPGPYFVIQST